MPRICWPRWKAQPPPDLRGATLQGSRLAVLRSVAFDDIRPAPKAAFDSALDRLQAAGASVKIIDIKDVSQSMTLTGILYTAEAYAQWRDEIEAAPDKMYPQILDRFRAGSTHKATDYIAAWHQLARHRAAYAKATAGFDAVLIPSSPILPPNLARLETDPDYYITENLLALRNTRIGNFMGLCALTLPTGVPSCGISMMAPPMAERRLLRLGAAAERALR
jgi:aspartyl-tRNA(Asn)/glutamyl-tRNA(Gln) amidotransferase subunit A